jgi:hypothetical protein
MAMICKINLLVEYISEQGIDGHIFGQVLSLYQKLLYQPFGGIGTPEGLLRKKITFKRHIRHIEN